MKFSHAANSLVYNVNCLDVFPILPLVDAIVCDPPYFIRSISKRFASETSTRAKEGKDGVSRRFSDKFLHKKWDTLPDGMSIKEFHNNWASKAFSIMKDGAHLISFSSVENYHNMAGGIEDAGFEIRSMGVWLFSNANPLHHKYEGGISDKLSVVTEPFCIARKPFSGSLVNNIKRNGLGGLFTERNENTTFPTNVIHDGSNEVMEMFGGHIPASYFCARVKAKDRQFSNHATVKPLELMQYLCRLVTPPEGIVLDPFAGSGTTLEAAFNEGFSSIGIELEEEYYNDILIRLQKLNKNTLDSII